MKTQQLKIPGTHLAEYLIKEGRDNKLYLLLHGYAESGTHLFNNLVDLLPGDATILAPNGTQPIPKKNQDHWSLNFAWYFYDNVSGKYFIDYKIPALYIKNLLQALGLEETPVTLIGYSQGGYLAPFAALELQQVEKVVGLCCSYKHEMLPQKLPFPIYGLHGEDDLLVDPQNASNCHQQLILKGNEGQFQLIPNQGHRLTPQFLKHLKQYL